MPFHDWQFWVVTALMLCGALMVIRAAFPARGRRGTGREGDPSCPNCASGPSAGPTARRVSITIEKQRI